MIERIKKTIAGVAILAGVFAPALLPATTTYAALDCTGVAGCLDTGSCAVDDTDCASGDDATTKVQDLIKKVINIFSLVIGVVAVIMIILGGFKYITSGGDSGNVTGAKNTILYAVIGLIIVALAQIIVRFVLQNATGQAN